MTKAIVSTKKRNIHVHLDITKAFRYVDFARARRCDLSCVSKCELSEVLFFLVKGSTMRKSDNKSELEQTIEKKLDQSPTGIIPSKDKKSMIVIDCRVYTKKSGKYKRTT